MLSSYPRKARFQPSHGIFLHRVRLSAMPEIVGMWTLDSVSGAGNVE
ncbi:MAG: hypothetical protein P8L18_06660 [Verrucomicrobiota bacterium]|nr:hypothetical protein [Verrucomicrobiota bacterium]